MLEQSLVANFVALGRGVVWVPLRKAGADAMRAQMSILPDQGPVRAIRAHTRDRLSSRGLSPVHNGRRGDRRRGGPQMEEPFLQPERDRGSIPIRYWGSTPWNPPMVRTSWTNSPIMSG